MFNVVGSFSISLTKSQENSIGKRCWMALLNIDFPYLIFTDRTTPSLLLLSFMTISYDFSDPMNQHHVSFREMIFLGRWLQVIMFMQLFQTFQSSVVHLYLARFLLFWICLALFLKSFSSMLLTSSSTFEIAIPYIIVFGVNIGIWISSSM